MSVSRGKCYLKRKRFLNEVSQEILKTLQHIYFMRNEVVSDSTLKEQSQNYAQKIEAVCLTPKYKMSNDEYHNVLVLKTQELCDVLKRSMIPSQSSPIPINVNQQQQSLQQTVYDNGIDTGNFSDKTNNKLINNDKNDQKIYAQDALYDLQLSSEGFGNHHQFSALNSAQATPRKTRNRKSAAKSSMSSKMNANQRSLSSLTVQTQPREYNDAFERRKNCSINDQQQSCYSSIENDVTNKQQLNCNNYAQDLSMYDETASSMGDFVQLQKNCSTEGGTSHTTNQGGSSFLQVQAQHQFLENDADKTPSLKYDFDRGSNDLTTVFSVSTKDADLFPVAEGNYNHADPFTLPDESFFDNSVLKDGLDFSDQMSFNFM